MQLTSCNTNNNERPYGCLDAMFSCNFPSYSAVNKIRLNIYIATLLERSLPRYNVAFFTLQTSSGTTSFEAVIQRAENIEAF